MAATVSSVWAKPGAWALDSEENEEELKREIDIPKAYAPPSAAPPAADFPSLSAAAAAAKPKKKNKGQTLSLAAFSTYSAPKRADDVISLPTGPRERTAEELDRTRLGGGFRNYGGGNGNDSSRVRVSDRNREGYDGNSGRERDLGPSRADEVDDWSKGKKVGSFGGGGPDRSERRERVGFFNSSRADEVDNWGSNKSFAPAPVTRERRMGFGESYSNGAGPDADTWGRRREERPVAADSDTWGRRREERTAADSENWGRKREEESSNNPNGVGGRPRLNLQPRTMPVANNGVPPSVVVTEGAGGGKPKGSNPFGEARPREEVLAEKGKDWKEIDEKLEAVKIKEVGGGDKGETFGRRKGFGMTNSGDDKTVKSWRKPESNDANVANVVSSPPSEENNENSAEVTENDDSVEKVQEEFWK